MKEITTVDTTSDEQGFALILSIFVIALLSILVLDFAKETIAFQQQSRAFTERIQGDLVLKSTLNLARLLLELPKIQIEESGQLRTVQEDWLGEPWALVASWPGLPIPGSPRLSIVDEASKLDLNAIVEAGTSSTNTAESGTTNPDGIVAGAPAGSNSSDDINNLEVWKGAMSELFRILGFTQEEYPEDQNRTPGNRSFSAEQQVAVIHDWIDSDRTSFSSAGFSGGGMESSYKKEWFYNRPLYSIAELAMVPGMTLERVARVAPFVRAAPPSTFNSDRVNVNTASRPVLLALGFPETQVLEIEEVRVLGPITSENLNTLIQGDQRLIRLVGVQSRSFSAYASISLANTTRWAKAIFQVQGGGLRRRATIKSLELH